jgi:hydrogenase expression/formation protein HypC
MNRWHAVEGSPHPLGATWVAREQAYNFASIPSTPLASFCSFTQPGIVKEVNLAFVPEAQQGDYVLVHVGFAITRIDEAESGARVRLLDGDRQQ